MRLKELEENTIAILKQLSDEKAEKEKSQNLYAALIYNLYLIHTNMYTHTCAKALRTNENPSLNFLELMA